MRAIRRLATCGLAALLTSVFVQTAPAQDATKYPDHVIRVIVGFAAGGGNDIFARLVVPKLQQALGGATIVVENKPGAGGRIAADYVAHQAPDGYTLMVGASGQMSVAAAIYHKIKYHPTKSFVPLAMIASFPLILVVPETSPIKSVAELVTYAKAHPDKSNYASSSPAFTIATELLKLKTGMPGTMIPYKSSNESNLSVVAGQSLLTISDGPPAMPLVKGGKTRALAVTGSERSPELPNVPSMSEAGYPAVNVKLWSGFFTPAGTPAPIVKKLEGALTKALSDSVVKERLAAMAVTPGGPTGDAFKKLIDDDIKNYAEVVKAAKLNFPE